MVAPSHDLPRLEISALSKLYVKVPVEVPADVDPTTPAIPVQMAVKLPGDEPAGGDWKDGGWAQEGLSWLARCLVGPGSDVGALAKGEWTVWLKITANPEIPAERVAKLLVT